MPQSLTVKTDTYNGKEYVDLPLSLDSDFSISYGDSEHDSDFIVEKDVLLSPFEIKYYKNGFLYTLDTNIKPVQNRELKYWYFPRKITTQPNTQLLLYFGQASTEYIVPEGGAVPFVDYFDNETEWLVEHNFNVSSLSELNIELKDENENPMFGGDTIEIDSNSFIITHDNALNQPVSGWVKVTK